MHAGASPQRRADWLRRSAGNIQINLRKIFHPNNLGARSCFGLGARGCFGLGPCSFRRALRKEGYCTACVTSLCACFDVAELLVAMKNATMPALPRDAMTRHVASRSGVWHRHRREVHEAAHDPTLGWHMLEYFGALYSRWVRNTGGVHVRVRFRDDPIGRNSRGDRDGAAEVLRRRNRCCGCFGRPLLRQAATALARFLIWNL